MTKHDTHDKVKAPINSMGADCALLHKRRLAHRLNPYANPNRGRWLLMGNDLRKIIFRLVVCLSIVIVILLLTAPKAC